jgi:hypothetical protein
VKTLAKYHDALFVTIAGGTGTIDRSLVSSGWTSPTNGLYVSQNYFDLAGLAMDDETIFFEGMAVQQSGVPAITGAAGDNYILYDIMTSIPIDTSDLLLLGNLSVRGLGYPGSELNYEHVLYSRTRRYTLDLDTTARMAMLALDEQSGSMAPTASDRIYCYRIVLIDAATLGAAANINVQPARYLIQAVPKEEPEFEYLMRLKRSYDLQQSPDED